jgi:DNA-binding IclR family transcriptional regulator
MPRGSEQRPYSSAVAVERAADLLFIIAERGEATLGELSKAIGSTGSAVHRILTALKNKGLIQQKVEGGPYSLSWSILALTNRLTADEDLRSLSLPHMRELRDLVGETVTLNVRSGFERVCIDQVAGPHEISWRHEIGTISPLYSGATGRAILAFMPDDELVEFWTQAKLERLTPHTLTDRGKLEAVLRRVRKQGVAFGSQDRMLGVGGMSAPILDADGRAVAALTIAGPADRCTPKLLKPWVEPLKAATGAITRHLADAGIDR